MNSSADSLRDRRTAERALALRTEARRLTIDQGLHGFTIEELCAGVGVSRRTFFNYYASKENAVIGVPVRADGAGLDEAFVNGEGGLLEDLAALHVARWDAFALTTSDADALASVFEREPRLFAHLMGLAEEGERDDIALVARRLKLSVTDVRAQTAVHLLGALLRPTAVEYFAADDGEFHTLLLRRLATARELFSL